MPVPDDSRQTTDDGKDSVLSPPSSVLRTALTERPACFEIDPRTRAVKQRLGCGSPTACAAATFSDRSPLHDVRQHARRTPAAEAEGAQRAQRCFLRTSL